MENKRRVRTLTGVFCVLSAALPAGLLLRLWAKGAALRAADPTAPVFTRAGLGGLLLLCAPVWVLTLLLAVIGTLGVVRDPNRNPAPTEQPADQPPRASRGLRLALLAAAVLLIAAGVLNGSMRDVWYKAVKICTECIGLG